jgi:hypothetical protein
MTLNGLPQSTSWISQVIYLVSIPHDAQAYTLIPDVLGEGDTPPTVNLDIFMETLTYHPVAIDL